MEKTFVVKKYFYVYEKSFNVTIQFSIDNVYTIKDDNYVRLGESRNIKDVRFIICDEDETLIEHIERKHGTVHQIFTCDLSSPSIFNDSVFSHARELTNIERICLTQSIHVVQSSHYIYEAPYECALALIANVDLSVVPKYFKGNSKNFLMFLLHSLFPKKTYMEKDALKFHKDIMERLVNKLKTKFYRKNILLADLIQNYTYINDEFDDYYDMIDNGEDTDYALTLLVEDVDCEIGTIESITEDLYKDDNDARALLARIKEAVNSMIIVAQVHCMSEYEENDVCIEAIVETLEEVNVSMAKDEINSYDTIDSYFWYKMPLIYGVEAYTADILKNIFKRFLTLDNNEQTEFLYRMMKQKEFVRVMTRKIKVEQDSTEEYED